MLSCSTWFSAPSLWMAGGLESRCVDRVCGADGAVHGTNRTVHCGSQDHHPSTNSVQKPCAATQRLHAELRIHQ